MKNVIHIRDGIGRAPSDVSNELHSKHTDGRTRDTADTQIDSLMWSYDINWPSWLVAELNPSNWNCRFVSFPSIADKAISSQRPSHSLIYLVVSHKHEQVRSVIDSGWRRFRWFQCYASVVAIRKKFSTRTKKDSILFGNGERSIAPNTVKVCAFLCKSKGAQGILADDINCDCIFHSISGVAFCWSKVDTHI